MTSPAGFSGARQLLQTGTTFIDVRSPAEFARGAVPGAVNLPVLNDGERETVGRTYKTAGQAAAIESGHRLVSGATRSERIERWRAFAGNHPQAWIYCWRGGLRSQIVQTWLSEGGVQLQRVPGGFKALRQVCLDVIEAAPASKRWLVLGGRTGSGKTRLLQQLDLSIDLEQLARHRGSAFGAQASPQPTPIDFENALAVAYLRHQHDVLVLEDESRTIGRLALPSQWHAHMQTAALVILETELGERCRNIREEYVDEPLAAGTPPAALATRLQDALDRIQRRLGGSRHKTISQALQAAFDNGDHERWIELLLSWYYDPMYDYQLESKRARVVARGEARQLQEVIRSY